MGAEFLGADECPYLSGTLAGDLLANVSEVDEIIPVHGHTLSRPTLQSPVWIEVVLESFLQASHLSRK